MSHLPEIWQTLAHKVLASVLVDHGAVFPVRDVLRGNSHWLPPKEALIWQSVLRCVDSDSPPTVEAVTARLNGAVPPGLVQSIANQWNDEDNRRVVYHAEELKRLGLLVELRNLGRLLSEVQDADQVEAMLGYAEAELSAIQSSRTQREAGAAAVSVAAWERLERGHPTVIPAGLDWFDQRAGGLWPEMDYWIVAAYKQGKSTLMRNMVLHACGLGHAVDVYVAEGSRELFALDCQAMLATGLLIEQGQRDKLRLSGLFIRLCWNNPDRAILTKAEIEAIHAARSMWEGYNLRVWDTKDGITDLGTLRYRVRQSKLDYGSLVHWLDYSQLFGKGETLFDRQSSTALEVQRIAQQEAVAVCVLAQKNEEAIRARDSYSPGVKGGGDAPAAADFLLVPSIDPAYPTAFNVQLKLSRHLRPGIGSTHVIEPESGLIIDRWVNKREPLAA